MTTLTLDQARTIIYSAASSDEALSALREIGAEVLSYEYDAYSVQCDDFRSVTFTHSPHLNRFFVMVDGELVTPEQRKAFLESQQQPTDTVPAVSPVAEAHPVSSDQLANTIPQTTVQMLDCFRFIFGIDTANGHYQDILFDVIKSHLFSHAINFNDLTVYEIRILMVTADAIFDHLMSTDSTNLSFQPPELTAICPRCYNPQADNFYSPEQETGFIYCSKCGYDEPRDHIYTPVSDANPVFTCFCPACDYDLAKANKDPQSDFYHVTCSICSLDRDFDSVEKS